ncbi:hypothetical protein ACSSS7_005778 [Eimeria intestinalis]
MRGCLGIDQAAAPAAAGAAAGGAGVGLGLGLATRGIGAIGSLDDAGISVWGFSLQQQLVAHAVQQDTRLSSAASGAPFPVSRLTTAIRRVQQQQQAAAAAGDDAREAIPGLHLSGRQHTSLPEVWGCMLFLFQGKLRCMQPKQLAALLDLLADAGPPALRFAHCSLVTPAPPAAAAAPAASAPAPAAAAAAAKQQGESSIAAGRGTHLLEETLAPSAPAAAPAAVAAAAAGVACSISERSVAGGPRWRPTLLQEVEELLLRQTADASLDVLIAAVNAPQQLLQPFDLMTRCSSSSNNNDNNSSSNSDSNNNSSNSNSNNSSSSNNTSSSSIGFRERFAQLLQPLLEPLKTLASPSPTPAVASAATKSTATTAAATEKAAAAKQFASALGSSPTAAAGLVDAPRLIALWHASLSLNVHAAPLAAAALQVSREVFPLLPLNCELLFSWSNESIPKPKRFF